jgi:ATP:corrinoid adenosyltransferase
MAKDHFVPRAYLRGFTAEYLGGSKGGQIVVYKPSSGASRRLSINEYVACEPEFYDNHPVDKEWSKTIEQKWPSVRQRLKDRQSDSALLDDLFWFVAAQYIRTHSFMHCIARQIAWEKAKRNPVKLEGEEGHGLILDMTDTADVMDAVQRLWPEGRRHIEQDYAWKVYHNSHSRLFLTSDDPCQGGDSQTASRGGVVMPLALDVALVGRLLSPGMKPTFGHSNASAEMVGKINRSTVRECRSFVYAHEETEELRSFVKKNHVKRDPQFSGRNFTNDPEPADPEKVAKIVKRLSELRRRDKRPSA